MRGIRKTVLTRVEINSRGKGRFDPVAPIRAHTTSKIDFNHMRIIPYFGRKWWG